MYWVYMVRCEDDSLYTGLTTDVPRRVQAHNREAKGARYTRARRPVTLVWQSDRCQTDLWLPAGSSRSRR
jgi:putative endonuclease